jgi:hypothetical protein
MAKAKRRPPAIAVRVRLATLASSRGLVLAIVAIAASVYAIVRHRTHPFEPMMVPRPAPTELPAPELIRAE